MRIQRSLLRPMARVLYAGGIVFLLLGILLSSNGGRVSAAGVTVSPRRWILPNLGLVSAAQDIPAIQFDNPSAALCQFAAGPVTAAGTYHLPPGQAARLQLTYYIVKPNTTETEYIDAGEVTGDGTFSITREWPGISVPYAPDLIVEIHFGANLLDLITGSPVVSSGAGFDYYWYPWVCTPTPGVAPATDTPTLTTQADTFTPTFTATVTTQADTFTPTTTVTEQPGVEDTFTPTPSRTLTKPTRTPTKPTRTPTLTATEGQPGVEGTFTPTVTNVVPPTTATFTPTVTNGVPPTTVTFTPTVTNVVPPTTATFTPTVTEQTGVEDTITPTPTHTLAPSLTFTPSVTASLPPLPSLTFTPSVTVPPPATFTFTPTVTRSPTATVAGPPNLTLESVCGYREENQQLWRITNNSPFVVEFLWQATATGETGTGVVAANNIAYVTTSGPPQNLRIYVGGVLLREVSSSAACLSYLELATTCTANNELVWMVFNNNPFAVNVLWTLDNQQNGSGSLAANSAALVTTSSMGAHSLSLSWEYPPLGQRTVVLNTDANTCFIAATPTNTLAPSLTPTVTLTATATLPAQPGIENTFTATATLPVQPGIESTFTPTATASATATLPAQPGLLSTFTPTATRLPTLGPPATTRTPILIPVTGMDLTPAGNLALIGRIFTNLGLLFLGAALLVTGALIRKH